MSLLAFLLALGVGSVAHVVGTFVVARAFRFRVPLVSVGVGPAILKKSFAGSSLQIGLLPFMSYVQIAGMNPLEPPDPGDTGGFANGSLSARSLTLLSGPLSMLASAFCVFSLALLMGYQTPSGPLSLIEADDTAAARVGDRVLAVEGQSPASAAALSKQLATHDKPTLGVVVQRGAGRETLELKPQGDDRVLGVTFGREGTTQRKPFAGVPGEALTQISLATSRVGAAVGVAFATRSLIRWPYRLLSPQGGLAAIVGSVLVYLGLFNLLPFPSLNGGRLLLLFYQGLARRPLTGRTEALLHGCGFVVVLLSALVVAGVAGYSQLASERVSDDASVPIREAAAQHQVATRIASHWGVPEPALRL